MFHVFSLSGVFTEVSIINRGRFAHTDVQGNSLFNVMNREPFDLMDVLVLTQRDVSDTRVVFQHVCRHKNINILLLLTFEPSCRPANACHADSLERYDSCFGPVIVSSHMRIKVSTGKVTMGSEVTSAVTERSATV